MIGFSFRRTVLTGLAALGFSAVLTAPALAQSATFRGKVTSEKSGQPLVGAAVGIGELGLTVLTNAQGNYVLTVPGLDGKSFAFLADDALNLGTIELNAQNAGMMAPRLELHSTWDAADLTASPHRIVITVPAS